jgi:hypothetical protein
MADSTRSKATSSSEKKRAGFASKSGGGKSSHKKLKRAEEEAAGEEDAAASDDEEDGEEDSALQDDEWNEHEIGSDIKLAWYRVRRVIRPTTYEDALGQFGAALQSRWGGKRPKVPWTPHEDLILKKVLLYNREKSLEASQKAQQQGKESKCYRYCVSEPIDALERGAAIARARTHARTPAAPLPQIPPMPHAPPMALAHLPPCLPPPPSPSPPPYFFFFFLSVSQPPTSTRARAP